MAPTDSSEAYASRNRALAARDRLAGEDERELDDELVSTGLPLDHHPEVVSRKVSDLACQE